MFLILTCMTNHESKEGTEKTVEVLGMFEKLTFKEEIMR